MKLSVSLPDDDVRFLDDYASRAGMASRSAALHRAVRLLRAAELGPASDKAWTDWGDGGEDEAWEPTVGDGLA